MVNKEILEHAKNVVPTHHPPCPYSRVALIRRRRSSRRSLFLLSLRLSASSTSTTTSSTLWRRSKGTVRTHLHHVIHLLLVVSLQIMPCVQTHSLVLDRHIHVKRLSVLQRVVLLLLVREILRLVQILLVLLQSDLEIESLRSLLETNTDVRLLAVLLDTHHEVTGGIQDGLDHRRTVVTDHGGSEHLLLVVHQLDVARLSTQNDVQRAKPDLVRPSGSTVSHTRVSWGNLINVASADVAQILLENIVVLHRFWDK